MMKIHHLIWSRASIFEELQKIQKRYKIVGLRRHLCLIMGLTINYSQAKKKNQVKDALSCWHDFGKLYVFWLALNSSIIAQTQEKRI